MDIFTTPGNQEGACLIELLLVFVIVGILISIGFPVYSVIIRRIEGVVCSTHNSHLNTMTHLEGLSTILCKLTFLMNVGCHTISEMDGQL